VNVWEIIRQGESGEFTVKSFEIAKAGKESDQSNTKNNFDATELLQLKAAIDKAINEETISITEGKEK